MKTFEELGVSSEIIQAITEMGYEHPMPVQEEVIPYLLGVGNDVIALAQTGTGKTAAYGLPILQKINPESNATQALILSPTRELCLQIAGDLEDYSKYIKGVHVLPVYGGSSIESQIKALRRGVQVVVATPGRLIDLMKRGAAKLDQVENVVLDEADEMLSMGFSDSIDEILEGVPEGRNTLLFSATMSKPIERIAKNYLHDAKEIVVGSRNEGAEHVNHIYYLVQAKDKYLALKRIADYNPKIYAIIFCRTRRDTQEVADKLIQDGYNADALHGDLSQQQRDMTMQRFRQHRIQFLVATDVAARGLDVDDLTHVINYGLPDDVESYTHRSGRTGRAGKRGTSISIIHIKERRKVREIEKIIGKEFVQGEIPSGSEICAKQLYKVIDDIEHVEVNEEDIAQFLPEVYRKLDWMDKEDIIKRVVTREFGRFLTYYADAPDITTPTQKGDGGQGFTSRRERGGNRSDRGDRGDRKGGGARQAESGYTRFFLNVGKLDGFYAREIMTLINNNIHGRIEIGRIDLMRNFSFFEVPQEDADRVLRFVNGATEKGRRIAVEVADGNNTPTEEGGNSRGGGGHYRERRDRAPRGGGYRDDASRSRRSGGKRFDDEGGYKKRSKKREYSDEKPDGQTHMKKDDWKQFFEPKTDDRKLKGDAPDFNEEGWARRKPKKK